MPKEIETRGNTKYKDRLFKFIFGNEKHKDWTLSLYNALNDTDYQNPDEIEINTMENVMYMDMHNDVSFYLAWELSMWEHQASWNPNMPVRFLCYIGKKYEHFIETSKRSKYGSVLIDLPVPRCVVFYNGKEEQFERKILRLSDAFPDGKQGDVEVTVEVINVNKGNNDSLLNRCKPLAEYAWLIDRIRINQKDCSLKEAIDQAITEMPDDYLIFETIRIHKAEVEDMLLTEYDKEKEFKKNYEAGRDEGFLEGRAEGRLEGREELERELLLKMLSAGMKDDEFFAIDEKYTHEYMAGIRKEWELTHH